MIEVKKVVMKEVEETYRVELVPFWLVRVCRGTNSKTIVAEQEFNYEPNEQEIASVLIDKANSSNCFASVIKNYRLVELKEQTE